MVKGSRESRLSLREKTYFRGAKDDFSAESIPSRYANCMNMPSGERGGKGRFFPFPLREHFATGVQVALVNVLVPAYIRRTAHGTGRTEQRTKHFLTLREDRTGNQLPGSKSKEG